MNVQVRNTMSEYKADGRGAPSTANGKTGGTENYFAGECANCHAPMPNPDSNIMPTGWKRIDIGARLGRAPKSIIYYCPKCRED
jgi:hypothetical protein